jgi:hypothetical protein
MLAVTPKPIFPTYQSGSSLWSASRPGPPSKATSDCHNLCHCQTGFHRRCSLFNPYAVARILSLQPCMNRESFYGCTDRIYRDFCFSSRQKSRARFGDAQPELLVCLPELDRAVVGAIVSTRINFPWANWSVFE